MSSQDYIDAAGKSAGLEIWRIEDAELAPVPRETYGTFYNGDSYVALHSEELKGGNFEYNIHFWLGEKTEQTEAGTSRHVTDSGAPLSGTGRTCTFRKKATYTV